MSTNAECASKQPVRVLGSTSGNARMVVMDSTDRFPAIGVTASETHWCVLEDGTVAPSQQCVRLYRTGENQLAFIQFDNEQVMWEWENRTRANLGHGLTLDQVWPLIANE